MILVVDPSYIAVDVYPTHHKYWVKYSFVVSAIQKKARSS